MANPKIERIKIGDEVAPHYVRVCKAGNFVFMSGIGGRDTSQDDKYQHQDGKKYVVKQGKGYPPTTEEQMEMMFKRATFLLAKAGATMDDVVFARVYLADERDLEVITPIMDKYWSKAPPATSVIGGCQFGRPQMRLECEIIAMVPDKK